MFARSGAVSCRTTSAGSNLGSKPKLKGAGVIVSCWENEEDCDMQGKVKFNKAKRGVSPTPKNDSMCLLIRRLELTEKRVSKSVPKEQSVLRLVWPPHKNLSQQRLYDVLTRSLEVPELNFIP